MPMHARAQRLARGWIVGLVATTLAAVSHSLAGGYQPGALSFGVALVFAGLLGTAVIGRRPSLPRLALAVAGSQLAFHLMFSMLGSGWGAASRMPGMSMPGMDMQHVSVTALSGHDRLADPGMWIAHAVAAALTILFLRKAELALWGMITRVVARITPAVAPVLGATTRCLVLDLPDVRTLAVRRLIASVSRRGPPLLSF